MNTEKLSALKSLKTARGQIDGILKMLEEERYCIDISNQILASISLLKSANLQILKQHINHCVKDAIQKGDMDEKINEIITTLGKVMK